MVPSRLPSKDTFAGSDGENDILRIYRVDGVFGFGKKPNQQGGLLSGTGGCGGETVFCKIAAVSACERFYFVFHSG